MNKKILILFMVFFGLIITGFPLIADSGSTGNGEVLKHSRSVEEVLSDIRTELGLGKNQSIDAGKVNDKFLEELGEAVMSYRIPDPKEHKWMDNMMGGEGSASLAKMHRIMGYNYLKYGSTGSFGFGPMMSGGMWGFGERGSMMGVRYPVRYYNWIFIALIIGLLTVVIVLALFLVRRGRKIYSNGDRFAEGSVPDFNEDALGILKKSYARGEISREEYLSRRDDIKEE